MAITANGHSNGVNGSSALNDKKSAATLSKVQKATRQSHVRNLSRLATLSTQIISSPSPTTPEDNTTVDEIISHGATTTFFGEILALLQKGELTREELDQKLCNWVLTIPGARKTFEGLGEETRGFIEEFRRADLKKGKSVPTAMGFRRPRESLRVYRCVQEMQGAYAEQLKIDGGKGYPSVVEHDGRPVRYVNKATFKNWGDTVETMPSITFVPKSVVGVQNIVKYAKQVNKKVRVSGYRHTWENFFADDNDILISLLPLDTAEVLPSIFGPFKPGPALLQHIHVLPNTVSADGKYVHAKIGTATTNEDFREWSLREKMWTLPLNVIMVEITFGGSISQICHGAGIRNKTLSDLVVGVEYVDAHGEVHEVTDPELLKTAAGAFGAFGIVTSYTIRLDKLTYANMRPYHAPIELAIPPPLEYVLAAKAGDIRYRYIKDLISQHSQETLDRAMTEFIRASENDYYAEWFWFPGQRDVWVNTWNNDGLESQARNIPSDFEAFLEWLEEWIGEEVNNWPVYQLLPGEAQAKILGFLTLLQLPNVKGNDPSLTTALMNALHFRRGIQNMQVCDIEWEIPIPPQASKASKRQSLPAPAPARSRSKRGHIKRFSLGKAQPPDITANIPPPPEGTEVTPDTLVERGEYKVARDWTIIQKAWWDAILAMNAEPSVVRVALEMRVMSGSDVIMAPQRGNALGTCSIEVLSTLNTPQDEWRRFGQKLTDKWLSYRDPTTGAKLNSRPHWCKQWSFLKIENGAERIHIIDWMRKVAYKNEIPEFVEGLRKMGEANGFTVDDCRARFGNHLLDSVVWGAPEIKARVPEEEKSREIINRFKRWLKKVFY